MAKEKANKYLGGMTPKSVKNNNKHMSKIESEMKKKKKVKKKAKKKK